MVFKSTNASEKTYCELKNDDGFDLKIDLRSNFPKQTEPFYTSQPVCKDSSQFYFHFFKNNQNYRLENFLILRNSNKNKQHFTYKELTRMIPKVSDVLGTFFTPVIVDS